ncbi:MAG TPA: UDP-N-acetylmuramoylalanyl-D-glutamyl-2,6-diaminopimelate--D-alanyl-D-alanine ligase [Alphaproteobacteria bacterium]|nr:UDP-N-acetylmuramoylalanyl-D-glutamyl-2,6-diaminopimelate--D-alanyl-D-alanine ligase [Alphaproteobacteria bacterium]
MTVLWTAKDAAAATHGAATGDWTAQGVSIDSRSVAAGDLFVAIKGPNFDGHAFVADALAKGAAAAVVSQRPAGATDATPLLIVKEPLAALEDLGRAARARVMGRIVAVTGSVGKTSTKEALKLVLSAQGLTHASEGSLNNHWGVPLSLSRLPQDARFGVFELGMNHAGELTPLSQMVRPHVAIITTIEAVHLEFFASVHDIATAKAEIFTGLVPGGIAVLNQDNDYFAYLAREAVAKGATVVAFGSAKGAWAQLLSYEPSAEGGRIAAEIGGKRLNFTVGAPGRHWALNSLAVLAAAVHLGADLEQAAATLANLSAPKGRGARHQIAIPDGANGIGAFTLIDESYNASPAALRATLAVLAGMKGRKIAVLGDMLELGSDSAAIHAGLAPDVAAAADLVCTAGRDMGALYEALPREKRAGHAAKAEDLLPLVRQLIRPGDAVMVKGSHGSRMGLIVDALLAGATPNKTAVNGH